MNGHDVPDMKKIPSMTGKHTNFCKSHPWGVSAGILEDASSAETDPAGLLRRPDCRPRHVPPGPLGSGMVDQYIRCKHGEA